MNFEEGAVTREPRRQWLELLLRERLTADLRLFASEDGWFIRIADMSGVVEVRTRGTDLHINSPGCGEWTPATERYAGVLKSYLPMPGRADVPQPLVERSPRGLVLHYDVLALVYWMLTRQEELGRSDLDEHGRFPAKASHAYKYGYLERPIVDEWLHVLGQIMERQWPNVELKQHTFSTLVSHDADNPSRYAFGGLYPLARMLAIDVIRRKDPHGAASGVMLRWRSRRALQADDPANTFAWIMDQSDKRGLTSAFYFICGRTNRTLDAHYDPEDKRIRALLRTIHERGHEIGLHPSYGTYLDPQAVAGEFDRLRQVCREEGIEQAEWGGRMHYLRWDSSVTLQAWDDAGLDYDSTLSYADAPGFRCGTCFEYPAFHPVRDKALALRIRPLIAMEATVMAERYLGLGERAEAFAKFAALKDACRAVDGTFTLLWHNSYLESDRLKDLYCRVLDA